MHAKACLALIASLIHRHGVFPAEEIDAFHMIVSCHFLFQILSA